ncbi:MAG: hypothetical protein EHM70_16745, partial [Chloroflexota bacterium]
MNKPVVVILVVILIILSPTGCAVPTQAPLPTDSPPIQPSPSATLTFRPPVPTASPAPTATFIPPTPMPTPIPRVRLPIRGLLIQFDRRGWDSEYWPGQVIQEFNQMDEVVGRPVRDEVAAQLDQMAIMGVNYLTIDVSSSNPRSQEGPYVPPVCYISPELGLQYPQPTSEELTNLVAYLDLIYSKGMKVAFRLVN